MGPEQLSDEMAVRAARGGSNAAFETLVRRHTGSVYRVAVHLVGSAEAEDCVQESWLRAWRALSGYRGDAAFRTWMYRVTTTTALMQLRRRRNEVALEQVRELPDATAGGDPERAGAAAAVRTALLQLPVEQRAVIVLREFGGLSYEELGAALQISVPAARNRLHRARRRLADLLEEWR